MSHQLLFAGDSKSQISLAKRLHALATRNGYQIIQTNGQRMYAPPDVRCIPTPPRGCELFIGKIPHDVYEDELIPLFEKYGTLYKFRLMLDFVERNRGYAFATYFDPNNAQKALEELCNHEIRPGYNLAVSKCLDNKRLFVSNIPCGVTRVQVSDLLHQYSQDVSEVIMDDLLENPLRNRGFAFVEYQTHRAAALARKKFTPDNLKAWGVSLFVDWASPEPDVDDSIMSKVTVLYLRNLPVHLSDEEIKPYIFCHVNLETVKKFHKIHHYAFLHLTNRISAEIAYRKLANLVIGNRTIYIKWARPANFSKKFHNDIPDHFCTSVPPRMRRVIYQLKEKSKTTLTVDEPTGSSNGNSSFDSRLDFPVSTGSLSPIYGTSGITSERHVDSLFNKVADLSIFGNDYLV